jgi:5-methylcytosine-specific restriction endonuclease McrA
MSTIVPCLDCNRLTSPGPRCPEHAAAHNRRRWARKPRNPLYRTPTWRRLSAMILREHRQALGDVCPGDPTHPAHPCTDLTVDHIRPISKGGAPFDRANLRVVCRSANGRKADR